MGTRWTQITAQTIFPFIGPLRTRENSKAGPEENTYMDDLWENKDKSKIGITLKDTNSSKNGNVQELSYYSAISSECHVPFPTAFEENSLRLLKVLTGKNYALRGAAPCYLPFSLGRGDGASEGFLPSVGSKFMVFKTNLAHSNWASYPFIAEQFNSPKGEEKKARMQSFIFYYIIQNDQKTTNLYPHYPST